MYFNLFRALLVLINIFALLVVNASPLPVRDGVQQATLPSIYKAVWERIKIKLPTSPLSPNEEELKGMIERLPEEFWSRARKLCSERKEKYKGANVYEHCIVDCVEEALISRANGKSWEPELRIMTTEELGLTERELLHGGPGDFIGTAESISR